MAQSEAGKGSSPRPYSVAKEEFEKNWDTIFGKKEKKPEEPKEEPRVEENDR
jgi:hypothetical protein